MHQKRESEIQSPLAGAANAISPLPLSAPPSTNGLEPPRTRVLRGFGAEHGMNSRTGLYPVTIMLCAMLLGFAATQVAAAGILAAAGAGSLGVLRERLLALLCALAMLALIATIPAARLSVGCWSLLALMMTAGLLPGRIPTALLPLPRGIWALGMILGAASICATMTLPALPVAFATVLGSLCAVGIGAGLTRHLAIIDTGVLSGNRDVIRGTTHDLLLGRIISGMLHDLAQPLNVIAMANGNLGYILEQSDIDAESRQQLRERIDRIAAHTEGAADILALFRGLGHEGSQGAGPPDVRSALGRALAATRSNVRHHVSVEMQGDALDYLVPGRHGTLEMIGVAALLSAFGAFVDAGGQKLKGKVTLDVTTSPSHIVVNVQCTDEAGRPIDCVALDNGTRWLVEQVADEAGGDLQCLPRIRDRPAHLIIRLARRDD